MSDSSETSQDIIGHHETWDDVIESQTKQIEKLQQEVCVLQETLEHALWHCHVYRHALRMLPDGYNQYKQSLAEHEGKLQTGNGSVSPQCERDELLKRIAYLEERTKSPILRSGQMREKNDTKKADPV